MKIGVNARLLIKPFTGIGQVTRNLLYALACADPGNEYILVVPEKIKNDWNWPKNVQIKVISEKHLGSGGLKKTWWEQITLTEFFKKEKVELALFTYPANPWSSDFKIKTAVMVHDTIPWTNKEYQKGILSRLYHSQTRKAVRKADLIITVSESSKKEVVEVCKVKAEKITVVYNDAGEAYKSTPEKSLERKVLDELKLSAGKYFLYVGGYDKRKNVDYLMREYSSFAKECRQAGKDIYPLVLAGGQLFEDKLYASFKTKESYGKIVKTGFIAEEELAVLYRNCIALVHFSSKEGFNIPILEAANCGAPLILSDIEVHREIAEEAAFYVNINKADAGKEALMKFLDSGVRIRYLKNLSDLAQKYCWQKSAKKLKNVLFCEK